MFAKALNRNLDLRRIKVLYICGNYFSILSRLDRRFQDLEIRRAFTVFQLMTILEEARHSLVVIEHDPRSTRKMLCCGIKKAGKSFEKEFEPSLVLVHDKQKRL